MAGSTPAMAIRKNRTCYRTRLFAADHRIALDLDLGIGICQGGDGDHGAAWKVVAEDFFADLSEPLAVANVGDEHGHLHEVRERASRLAQDRVEAFEDLACLTLEVVRQRLAGIVHGPRLPGEQTIRPPSVITAGE
jgi:hypothetical protein